MTLKRHIRRLLVVYRHPEHLLLDLHQLRETLIFHGITPSAGQLRATLNRDIHFILHGRALGEQPVARTYLD
jgi:predicted component of type VI protein secretion system